MGNYDEHEYARREKAISEIDYNSEDQPEEYRGELTFENTESPEQLLETFNKMKDESKD
ncbi:DUF5786 family protein [Halovenus rubra]|uniref:DUF5786 family protein n=2 Tax=Halovenus rubra TaxID=869890 RepID=A0ABD5XBU7_9EURY|nr:DUF5786 family protein [Halovenus rubra]